MKKRTFPSLILIATLLGLSTLSFAALPGPCEDELEKFCSNAQPGRGEVGACLEKYKDQWSPECREFVAKASHALKSFQAACSEDVYEYCRDVKTSFRRMTQCLKENVNNISPPCRALIKK